MFCIGRGEGESTERGRLLVVDEDSLRDSFVRVRGLTGGCHDLSGIFSNNFNRSVVISILKIGQTFSIILTLLAICTVSLTEHFLCCSSTSVLRIIRAE